MKSQPPRSQVNGNERIEDEKRHNKQTKKQTNKAKDGDTSTKTASFGSPKSVNEAADPRTGKLLKRNFLSFPITKRPRAGEVSLLGDSAGKRPELSNSSNLMSQN